MTFKKITAFTLAEILITLAIIGVVAAITIPSLMQKTQDQEFKTAYKKAYSDINNAFTQAKTNNEFIDMDEDLDNAIANFNTVQKYFKVTKTCTDSVSQGCWLDNCFSGDKNCFYTTTGAGDQAKSVGFIDNSGRNWALYKKHAGSWLIFIVDINGNKKPNIFARDRFPFFFYDQNEEGNKQIPVKVRPYNDGVKGSANCQIDNCYYTSWLMN